MPISANRLNVQALSVEFVDALIRVILEQIALGSNHHRHCERSEAIQGNVGRPATPGSPRRFAPRDDDSIRTRRALVSRF